MYFRFMQGSIRRFCEQLRNTELLSSRLILITSYQIIEFLKLKWLVRLIAN